MWDENIQLYKANVEINWRDDLQKGFPTFMKAVIPASDRSYDPPSKTWFFAEQWYPKVKGYVELGWAHGTLFFYTKEEAEQFAQQAQQSGEQQSYQQRVHSVNKYITQFVNIIGKLGLVDSSYKFDETYVQWSRETQLYRKASLKLHPDRNPNGANDMSLLNQAWSYIKADRDEKELQKQNV
jgi:hypothetical protein